MEQYNVTHKYIIITTTREYLEVVSDKMPNIGDVVTGYNDIGIETTGIAIEITDEITVLAECALSSESRLMSAF